MQTGSSSSTLVVSRSLVQGRGGRSRNFIRNCIALAAMLAGAMFLSDYNVQIVAGAPPRRLMGSEPVVDEADRQRAEEVGSNEEERKNLEGGLEETEALGSSLEEADSSSGPSSTISSPKTGEDVLGNAEVMTRALLNQLQSLFSEAFSLMASAKAQAVKYDGELRQYLERARKGFRGEDPKQYSLLGGLQLDWVEAEKDRQRVRELLDQLRTVMGELTVVAGKAKSRVAATAQETLQRGEELYARLSQALKKEDARGDEEEKKQEELREEALKDQLSAEESSKKE